MTEYEQLFVKIGGILKKKETPILTNGEPKTIKGYKSDNQNFCCWCFTRMDGLCTVSCPYNSYQHLNQIVEK